MKIDGIIGNKNLISKLMTVKLKGKNQFPIYNMAERLSYITLEINSLSPCQNYVMKPTIDKILDINKSIPECFDLTIGLMIDHGDEIIPFLPPIIEEHEIEGKIHLIVMDGMHRLYTARKIGETSINCILIQGLKYPYYAYPLENGWKDVVELDVMVPGFEKKRYTEPDDYKALFRDINAVFPGIQKKR
jgi:hypothetical protein